MDVFHNQRLYSGKKFHNDKYKLKEKTPTISDEGSG
jgi:hypothetical protein